MTRSWLSRCSAPAAAAPGARRAVVRGLAAVLVLAAVAGCGQTAVADSVSLETARAEFEAGRVTLIDIREPEEHVTGVAAGAQLLPLRQLNRRLSEIPVDPARPVLLICNTQNRSSATLRALREHGYGHVRFVQGGMSEWVRRGWPVVRPAGAGGP